MSPSASGLVWASFLVSAMPAHLTGQDPAGDAASIARRMGSWGPVIELPTHPEQMAVLPSGKVLMWPWAPERRTPPHGPVALWNPEDGSSTIFRGSGIESASGLAFQPDGVLLSAGGDLPDGGIDGNARAFAFDYRTEALREVAAMQGGRVFPSATTLPGGEILVSAGLDRDHEISAVPVLWDGESWTRLPEAYNDESQGPRFQFVAPDGRLFRAGPEPLSDWLDIESRVWIDTDAVSPNQVRYQGTAVMYEPGKILLVGGCPAYRCEGSPPVATAEAIDLLADPPVWRKVGAMSSPRHSHHATLLPDGTVLITGGTDRPNVFNGRSDGILVAELWDPGTESFEQAASMAAPRHFQSAASQGWNGTQRRVSLRFTTESGTVRAEVPNDPNLAPPGFYLVFILNDRGVPSVGRPMHIRPREGERSGSRPGQFRRSPR